MKGFNNLPEKLKLRKECKDIAEQLSVKYGYPPNFIIESAKKRIYLFTNKYGNKEGYLKEDNEYVKYEFLNELKELKKYPLTQLFNF